jgi:hypothetical protein
MSESDGDSANEESDGYVHRPSGEPPQQAEPSAEFGRHGWVLIGMLVVAFFLVPGAIYLLPAAEAFIQSLGLTLRAAYLTLPLVPAFVLGLLAVWSALRSRAD